MAPSCARLTPFGCAVAQVIDEMHRKLGMAREQVDLAQARKEELWEKGAGTCKTSPLLATATYAACLRPMQQLAV